MTESATASGAWPGILDGVQVVVNCVALLFAVAGVSKLADRRAFESALLALPFLPAAAATLLARTLPVVELGISAGLLGGVRFAQVGAAVLLAAFSAVTGIALRRRLSVRCSCFGNASRRPLSRSTIARNVLLAAMVVTPGLLEHIGFGPIRNSVPAMVAAVTVSATLGALLAVSRYPRGWQAQGGFVR